MKNLRFLTALVSLTVCLLAAGPAAAEIQADAFTLSPMIGGHVFEGNQPLDDDWTFGLGIGYNYSKDWGTELLFHYTDTSGVDVYNFMLNGMWYFMPDQQLVPYFTLGAGAQTRDNGGEETDFLLNYGIGLKYFLTDTIALRGDVRHLLALDQGIDEISKGHDNLLYTAGLTFQFGAPAPAPVTRAAEVREEPAPAPAPYTAQPAGAQDSDNDGVPDDRDECPGTAEGVMVDEKGCPLSLSIHIEFDFDKAEIKPEHRSELQKAADFIDQYDAPQILIAGHTDSVGPEAYNQELSERRAAAVRQYLIDNHNLDPQRLVSRGYGESQPVASNETPQGRAQNRRTDIICCVYIPPEE